MMVGLGPGAGGQTKQKRLAGAPVRVITGGAARTRRSGERNRGPAGRGELAGAGWSRAGQAELRPARGRVARGVGVGAATQMQWVACVASRTRRARVVKVDQVSARQIQARPRGSP